MISIISVAYNSKEWEDILRFSARKTKGDYELLIHDNTGFNIGHAGGVDKLIKEAKGEYILLLDIDAHILLDNWDEEMLKIEADLIAAEGSISKPVRPCAMFFKREWFLENNFSFKPVKTKDFTIDCGVYFAMAAEQKGFKVKTLKCAKTEFKDVWGNEYLLNGKRFVYHNWYGTRFCGGKYREIDGRKYTDYLEAKISLLKQI